MVSDCEVIVLHIFYLQLIITCDTIIMNSLYRSNVFLFLLHPFNHSLSFSCILKHYGGLIRGIEYEYGLKYSNLPTLFEINTASLGSRYY